MSLKAAIVQNLNISSMHKLQITEIHSLCLVDAIGRGTGQPVRHIEDQIPTIVSQQLLRSIKCRLKNGASRHHLIEIDFDWPNLAMSIHVDGDRVEVPIENGITLPQARKHADKIASVLQKIVQRFPTSELEWHYHNDADAVRNRGKDYIRRTLETRNLTAEEKDWLENEECVGGVKTSMDFDPAVGFGISRIRRRVS